jgi:hypothetical protein
MIVHDRRADPEFDPSLPKVAGRSLTRSLYDFQRACLVTLAEEQAKPLPDNALVALLCDAVRLSREQADFLRGLC